MNINDKIVIVNKDYIEATNKMNEFEKRNNKTKINVKLNDNSKLNDTIMIRHQTVDEALYNCSITKYRLIEHNTN